MWTETAYSPRTMPDPMQFSRRFRELVAGETHAEIARRMRYTAGRVGQVARGERPSREFVERLVEAYNLPRDEWLSAAGIGLGPEKPDEREELALRAATLAVEKLMNRRLPSESVAQLVIRRIAELNATYGLAARVQFSGGVENLTEEEAIEILNDIEAQLKEEVSQSKNQPKE